MLHGYSAVEEIPKIIFLRDAGGVGAIGLRGGEEEEEEAE
jgi:hypothetical protein